MRRILPAAMLAMLVAMPAVPAQATHPNRDVVAWPVAFRIVNENRSATWPHCRGDGASYTMRGAIAGPATLASGDVTGVTLYVHGSGDASTWHFTAVGGVDHVTEMARLGHVSVFVHLLGYGTSDPVDGNAVCWGAYADHVAQLVGQLRNGSYKIEGRPAPPFSRVALAGHSAGGNVVELAQVSFAAADALVVAGWTDYALGAGVADDLDPLLPFPYGSTAGFAGRCATEPQPKQPQGPGGWAYNFTTRGEMDMLVHDIDPRVMDAFVTLYEQDPCGWGLDFAQSVAANVALTPAVDVPVLLANGDRDPIAPPAAVELQRARYAVGGGNVSSLMIPATGHQVMLERSAPTFRAGLSHWLNARGF